MLKLSLNKKPQLIVLKSILCSLSACLITNGGANALTIYETTPFETISVDSRLNVYPATQPKQFTSTLELGRAYKFVAFGNWTPDYRPPIGVSGNLQDYINDQSLLDNVQWLVDPRYVHKSHYVQTVEDEAPPYGDFGLFSSALGGDGDDFWGPYNQSHVYVHETAGTGTPVDFYVSDINFDDNYGAYSVQVFREVPGPLPLLGAGVAWSFSRKLRQRIKKNSEGAN